MSDRTAKDPPLDAVMMLGDVKVHVDPSMPRGTVEMRGGEQRVRATIAADPTEGVAALCGQVERLLATAATHGEEMTRLVRELAKADRRTAEQERIIAAQREKLEALRAGLTVALDCWVSVRDDSDPN